jgi:hypothetical protein
MTVLDDRQLDLIGSDFFDHRSLFQACRCGGSLQGKNGGSIEQAATQAFKRRSTVLASDSAPLS